MSRLKVSKGKVVKPLIFAALAFLIVAGASCSLTGGLTAEKVKEEMTSAFDGINNYAYTDQSQIDVNIVEAGVDPISSTTTYTSSGKADLANEKMYSDIDLNQAGQKTESQVYIAAGYIYQNALGTWSKTKLTNKEDYFQIEGQKVILNNSTIEIMEENPLHIKLTPDKSFIGDKFMAQIMQGDSTFGEQYEINYDQAFTELDIEYWLDSEYRITKMVTKMTLKLDKDVITAKTEGLEEVGENESMTMSTNSTTNINDYNSQEDITLPDEAKSATEMSQ